jgi:tRNA threonylcarbamoyl adenosine modification protein YeaZ
MYGLLIDTSGHTTLVALSDQGQLLDFVLISSSKISLTLSSTIEHLLKKQFLLFTELHYIAVGIGPGSFLGTRTGVITAKTFSYSLQIPLVSFCSLQAYQPETPSLEFYVVSDAKSQGVYLLKGKKTCHSLTYDTTPTLCSIQEFKNLASSHPDVMLITSHQEPLKQKLSPLPLTEVAPSLETLCKYCYEKMCVSEIEDLESLAIHYLRFS